MDQAGTPILNDFSEIGRSPLGLAAARGDIEKIDELINGNVENAIAADQYGDTPLHLASQYGHFEAVKFLIRDFSVPLDPVNWEGWSPLFCAISRGHIEISDFLVRNGASLVHTTPAGHTVMHIAAWYNQPVSIEFLVKKQVDIRLENAFGCLPIVMSRPGPIKRLIFTATPD